MFFYNKINKRAYGKYSSYLYDYESKYYDNIFELYVRRECSEIFIYQKKTIIY